MAHRLGVAALAAGSLALAGAAPGARGGAAPRIDSLTVAGTPASPVFTVAGAGLRVPPPDPKGSPSNRPLCPLRIGGDAGRDYGTRFYLLAWDGQPDGRNGLLYAAGRSRRSPNELDCIGLVVGRHSARRVTFTLGHAYAQYFATRPRLLRDGDVVEVVLDGAAVAAVVRLR